MQTASSASFTYLASRSASEYTTTVLISSSRQARWIRRAISPRLAISIFLNIRGVGSLDDEQRLPELDRLAVLAQDLRHGAGLVRLDLVHDLHRLDDADRLGFLDRGPDLGKGLGSRTRRSIERPDHRRLDHMSGV